MKKGAGNGVNFLKPLQPFSTFFNVTHAISLEICLLSPVSRDLGLRMGRRAFSYLLTLVVE